MESFVVDVYSKNVDKEGKTIRLRHEFEQNLARLNPKTQTILTYQGKKVFDALRKCTEECLVMIFGDVLDDPHAKSLQKLTWEEIKRLEQKHTVVKLCFLKPTEKNGQICLSDESVKVVKKLKNEDVNYVLSKSKSFHLSQIRFEIFRILWGRECGLMTPDFSNSKLWIAEHLDDGTFNHVSELKYQAVSIIMLGDAMGILDSSVSKYLDKVRDPGGIRTVVEDVFNQIFRPVHHIVDVARSICLQNEEEIIGNTHNRPWTTRRHWIVKDLKRQLVDKTLKELSIIFAKESKQSLNEYIGSLFDVSSDAVSNVIDMVKEIIPDDVMVHAIESVLFIFFAFLKDFIMNIVLVFVSVFVPVDVNSNTWRDKIAREIHSAISKKKEDIILEISNEIMKTISKIHEEITPELQSFLTLQRERFPIPIISLWQSQEGGTAEYLTTKQHFLVSSSPVDTYPAFPYTMDDYMDEEYHRKLCMDAQEKFRERHLVIEAYPGTRDLREHVFVLLVPTSGESLHTRSEKFEGHTVIFKSIGQPSTELSHINVCKKELKVKANREERKKAIRIINEKGEKLMQEHSNLTSISVGSVKSIQGGKTILSQTCIALYCKCKGVIPLGESLFPTELGDVPTDVREGFVLPAGCTGYCDPLAIGCSIGLEGRPAAGSLGLFLREKNNLECCGFTTCFHVVLDVEHSVEDRNLYKLDQFDVTDIKKILQPGQNDIGAANQNASSSTDVEMVEDYFENSGALHMADTQITSWNGSREGYTCGYLKHAFHGNVQVDGMDVGVDVAYIQITARNPDKAKFASIPNGLVHKFPNEELEITGVVDTIYEDDAEKVVYKCGRTTGLTRGTFDSGGTMLSMRVGSGFRCLKNQYEIVSTQNEDTDQFFDLGDSGAAVFEKRRHKLYCMGIGVAVSDTCSSRCFVTPIKAVLKALACPELNCPELELRKFRVI